VPLAVTRGGPVCLPRRFTSSGWPAPAVRQQQRLSKYDSSQRGQPIRVATPPHRTGRGQQIQAADQPLSLRRQLDGVLFVQLAHLQQSFELRQ
jgi:hypothetical protein